MLISYIYYMNDSNNLIDYKINAIKQIFLYVNKMPGNLLDKMKKEPVEVFAEVLLSENVINEVLFEEKYDDEIEILHPTLYRELKNKLNYYIKTDPKYKQIVEDGLSKLKKESIIHNLIDENFNLSFEVIINENIKAYALDNFEDMRLKDLEEEKFLYILDFIDYIFNEFNYNLEQLNICLNILADMLNKSGLGFVTNFKKSERCYYKFAKLLLKSDYIFYYYNNDVILTANKIYLTDDKELKEKVKRLIFDMNENYRRELFKTYNNNKEIREISLYFDMFSFDEIFKELPEELLKDIIIANLSY